MYSFLSGRESLQLTGRLRGLAQPALDGKIDDLLELFGLSTARFSAIASYSKGMRQKALLASALLHNPDLVILDEPFPGLDVSTAQVLKALLKKRACVWWRFRGRGRWRWGWAVSGVFRPGCSLCF